VEVYFDDKVYDVFEQMRNFSKQYNVECDAIISGECEDNFILGKSAIFLPESDFVKNVWTFGPKENLFNDNSFERCLNAFRRRNKYVNLNLRLINNSRLINKGLSLFERLNYVEFTGNNKIADAIYLPKAILHSNDVLRRIRDDNSIVGLAHVHPWSEVRPYPPYLFNSFREKSKFAIAESFSSVDYEGTFKTMGNRTSLFHSIVYMDESVGDRGIKTEVVSVGKFLV
jgi:hypothetical protein